MGGLFVVLVLAVAALAVWGQLSKRMARVHDASGHSVGGIEVGRAAVLVAALVLALVLLGTTFRVVPVGHGLVVFNTLSKRFSLATEGITFVPPMVSVTALYDLRRQEYTMSGTTGEGRKANIDDSLWSPTKEGLQVGIDLTVWHHIDPKRLVRIHQTIGPDYEEKVLRPAVRSVIRLVISEYPVMDVYSEKRADIQNEINSKIKRLVEPDGFIIDELVLRDVRFTPEFTKAIEAKTIAQQSAEQMKYTLEKEQKEAERKVIEARGRANAIEVINQALAQNPNYIKYLYVDKLSDKIAVIVSDQNTIMDLKGILDSRHK